MKCCYCDKPARHVLGAHGFCSLHYHEEANKTGISKEDRSTKYYPFPEDGLPPDKCGICGEEANHFRGNEAFCMKHYFEEREKEAYRDLAEQKVKDFRDAISLPPCEELKISEEDADDLRKAPSSRCGSCKHEYEEKVHPLDERINNLIRNIDKQWNLGTLKKELFAIRSESIKWGLNNPIPQDRMISIEDWLKENGHEDWIV